MVIGSRIWDRANTGAQLAWVTWDPGDIAWDPRYTYLRTMYACNYLQCLQVCISTELGICFQVLLEQTLQPC